MQKLCSFQMYDHCSYHVMCSHARRQMCSRGVVIKPNSSYEAEVRRRCSLILTTRRDTLPCVHVRNGSDRSTVCLIFGLDLLRCDRVWAINQGNFVLSVGLVFLQCWRYSSRESGVREGEKKTWGMYGNICMFSSKRTLLFCRFS